MKKLNKLQINSEKLMNNEELMILRGGYNGYIICQRPWYYGPDCTLEGVACENSHMVCDLNCFGWESAICVG